MLLINENEEEKNSEKMKETKLKAKQSYNKEIRSCSKNHRKKKQCVKLKDILGYKVLPKKSLKKIEKKINGLQTQNVNLKIKVGTLERLIQRMMIEEDSKNKNISINTSKRKSGYKSPKKFHSRQVSGNLGLRTTRHNINTANLFLNKERSPRTGLTLLQDKDLFKKNKNTSRKKKRKKEMFFGGSVDHTKNTSRRCHVSKRGISKSSKRKRKRNCTKLEYLNEASKDSSMCVGTIRSKKLLLQNLSNKNCQKKRILGKLFGVGN